MNDVKIIGNILPFNEVFYRNCFYNSLFPIITHYNKDILSILINDISVYDNVLIDNGFNFMLKYTSAKSIEVILDDMGIKMKSLNYREDIISDIIKSINQNNPVIIYIDCFYEPFRKDAYHKNHWIHSLLIYGYDEQQGIMNIVEHKHRDNLSYENRTIKYEDIKNAYENYHINFENKAKLPSYFEFSLKDTGNLMGTTNPSNEHYKKVFKNMVHEKENEASYGLEQLTVFSKLFKDILLDENLFKSKIDDLINSFNTIINIKQVEIFKLSRLFGQQHKLAMLQQEITQYWILIRAIIAKYKFSNIYNRESLETVLDKINMIINDENLYKQELNHFLKDLNI